MRTRRSLYCEPCRRAAKRKTPPRKRKRRGRKPGPKKKRGPKPKGLSWWGKRKQRLKAQGLCKCSRPLAPKRSRCRHCLLSERMRDRMRGKHPPKVDITAAWSNPVEMAALSVPDWAEE